MLTAVNQVSLSFVQSLQVMYFHLYLLSSIWTHPCYFPHTLRLEAAAQRIDEGAMEFSRRPLGVLDVQSP